MRVNGLGKRAGNEWKKTMEANGFKVVEKYTSDNQYGYREIRKKDPNFVDAIRVWVSGRGYRGLWYVALKKGEK